jgi:[protein-PII] uridylyltransferase
MLYLLTFADVRAVGPEAWTSWKDSLLTELFLKTAHLLETGENTQVSQKEHETIERLMDYLHLKGSPEYAEHLPTRYLSCYGWGEIVHHIEMALSLERDPLSVRWTLESGRLAKVTLCTKDSYGLFSKIAGCMFLNRLNILEAQIHTWGNGVALDTFYVEDATEEVERRLHHFKRDAEEILNGRITVKDLFSEKGEFKPNQQKIIPGVVAEVKVNNRDSDFYTIIEITGEDRLGILYEITQALTDHGCNISFSRISTLGNRIVDVFYVQDEWGEKIEEKQKVDHLKQVLLNHLTRESTTPLTSITPAPTF